MKWTLTFDVERLLFKQSTHQFNCAKTRLKKSYMFETKMEKKKKKKTLPTSRLFLAQPLSSPESHHQIAKARKEVENNLAPKQAVQ